MRWSPWHPRGRTATRQRTPEGNGCFGRDSGNEQCPDGLSPAAWLRLGSPEGVCFHCSRRCLVELKVEIVTKSGPGAHCLPVPSQCQTYPWPPGGPALGAFWSLAFPARASWLVITALLVFKSGRNGRSRLTPGLPWPVPGSPCMCPGGCERPTWYRKPGNLPIMDLWAKVFKEAAPLPTGLRNVMVMY